MRLVELYARVRYAVRIEGISRREAARRFGIDPRTVGKMLSFSVPPGYRRSRGASRISADFYGRKGLFEPIRAILNPLCPSAAEYGVLTWCAIRIAHHVNTPYSAAEGQSGFRMARIGSKSPFLP